MPRTAAVAASVAALAIAGCGGTGEPERLLPAGTAATVRSEVILIGERVGDGSVGACDDIFDGVDGGNFQDIDTALSDVPEGVDPEIRAALEQSIDRLRRLVEDACDDIAAQEEQEIAPEETTTEETETTPTETETIETETAPTTDEPLPPADEQPERPQGRGDGGDKGNGRGPTGDGPPGQDGDPDSGGVEAPDDD